MWDAFVRWYSGLSRNGRVWLPAIGFLLGIGVISNLVSPPPSPTPTPLPRPSVTPTGNPPRAEPTFSSAARRACLEGLTQLANSGLIRDVAPDRIDVEDAAWAATPARDKELILRSMACASRGRPLRAGERSEAYGFRSGKLLAHDGVFGVVFD
ncbi:hypothetical protein [Sphingomonas sp.]|jgi:hypothetical protein|uniref:hypothetical protein n=1 Tax=Sphingomonas sp. TaxID=28214 RepID=UPI002D7FDF57|nr:hypothetical protein [Sphingomonas sp.]HEU0045077.1 hypothetical protein [Sphingomonas sp.]